jgi:hypothetical protein
MLDHFHVSNKEKALHKIFDAWPIPTLFRAAKAEPALGQYAFGSNRCCEDPGSSPEESDPGVKAVKLMRKPLKKQGFAPDVLVTDKLRSYGPARSEIGLSARHEQGLRKNNRAEIRINRHDDASVRCSGSNRPISPTVPVRSRRRSQHVQRPASSHIPPHASRPKRRSAPDVASRHCGLKFSGPSKPRAAPLQVGVTAPSLALGRSARRAAG